MTLLAHLLTLIKILMKNNSIASPNIKSTPILEGHRKRLRDRFINSGLYGFHDYEVVELLLTLGTPRKDCKQIAKEAIKQFKTLRGVLNADTSELTEIKGIGPTNASVIVLYKAISERYLRETISSKTLLNSSSLVGEYLKEKIGNKKEEHFTIMYFDTRNKLINEKVSIGTLNASLVHPREVFKRAIKDNAAQIILSHNHPSGDPKPSKEDILTSNRLIKAGKLIGISIIDHIIVTSDKYFSLKENGYIKNNL